MAWRARSWLNASSLALLWRRLTRRVVGQSGTRLRMTGPAPERITLAPPDLEPADPLTAQDLYAGRLFLAGRALETHGANPFSLTPPDHAFSAELHGFGWLRHLAAAGDALAARHAQASVKDWILLNPRPRAGQAWQPETAARRLIAWLMHSVMLVEGADAADYRRLLRSLGKHVRWLRLAAPQSADGLPRLLVHIALAFAAVCLAGRGFTSMRALSHLDAELLRQIREDGGHASRNAALLPDLLALLLPLRQSIARQGQPPSPVLVSTIDRMMQALRVHRLGDGSLARFNGVSTTPFALLATLQRYNESLGEPPAELHQSGYVRLERGSSVILVDCGAAPPGELSARHHAGCLSFEMSTGTAPLIVNCGAPARPTADTVRLARTTAAHSTATIDDTSSARLAGGAFGRFLGNIIVAGPRTVTRARVATPQGAMTLAASHDGYGEPFGLLHAREMELSADGAVLTGVDSFPPAGAPRGGDHAVILRFHLHPTVGAEVEGDRIRLVAASGVAWHLTSADAVPTLEPSVYFADGAGQVRTRVVTLTGSSTAALRWRLARELP